jgi:hypothetical protein
MSLPSSTSSVLIRPSAPSPKEQMTLVPFSSPLSSEDSWPSPDLSAIHSPHRLEPRQASLRVTVLMSIGELFDANMLSAEEAGDLIEITMRGDKEVLALSDLLQSRATSHGKASFLKLFLKPARDGRSNGFTTPNPTYHEWQVSGLYHPPTPFVDIPSPLVRSASPPLRYPTAVRPAPVKLSCIREDLGRTQSIESNPEEPKYSPESFKSTNAGSSIDTSTVSPPNDPLTRESNTASVTPDKFGCAECSPQS